MRLKWLRLLVPVGALLALAFVLPSCGDDDGGGEAPPRPPCPRSSPPVTARPGRRQGGRRAEGARGGRHRLHGSRRRLLPVHLHGHAGDSAGPVRLGSRTTSTSRRRTSPRQSREISDDGLTIEFTIRDGVQVQPAGGSRGDRRGRRVRDRALDASRRGEPVRRELRLGHRRLRRGREGGRRQPDRRRARHRGGERARRQDASDRARRAPEGRDREGGRPDAVAAGERARAGGVREGVRRGEPLDLRPVRLPSRAPTWSRTTPRPAS